MIKSATVHVRIDSELKNNAENVLKKIGLSSADAIRMLYKQIELRQGIPFDISIPNDLTEKTLSNSQNGIGVNKANNTGDLFSELDI